MTTDTFHKIIQHEPQLREKKYIWFMLTCQGMWNPGMYLLKGVHI